VDNAEITHWSQPSPDGDDYDALFSKLHAHIQKQGHSKRHPHQRRTVLRIVLHSLGSPLWQGSKGLPNFLLKLRHLLQSAFACALITIPSDLLEPSVVETCEHLSDTVVRLQSLANNPNPAYSEYNGLLTVVKLACLNTLTAHVPDNRDWAFKLRKRRFVVEKLHLPPELQETAQREQDDVTASPACTTAVGSAKAIDF